MKTEYKWNKNLTEFFIGDFKFKREEAFGEDFVSENNKFAISFSFEDEVDLGKIYTVNIFKKDGSKLCLYKAINNVPEFVLSKMLNKLCYEYLS